MLDSYSLLVPKIFNRWQQSYSACYLQHYKNIILKLIKSILEFCSLGQHDILKNLKISKNQQL